LAARAGRPDRQPGRGSYPWVRLRQLLARFRRRITLAPYAVTAAGQADTGDIAAKVTCGQLVPTQSRLSLARS
jgi:cysteine desulfurase / selenocysteine lyase